MPDPARPIFHKLPGGRLCVDGGKDIPDEPPAGYERDEKNLRLFHPVNEPAPVKKHGCKGCRGL
jgi:hypothetical protein